jgi:hypothetical protein
MRQSASNQGVKTSNGLNLTPMTVCDIRDSPQHFNVLEMTVNTCIVLP